MQYCTVLKTENLFPKSVKIINYTENSHNTENATSVSIYYCCIRETMRFVLSLLQISARIKNSSANNDSAAVLTVEAFMDFFKMAVGDVRVNLGRVDRGVAEELLDASDVGAVT